MSEAKTPRPATPRDGVVWVTGASSGIGRATCILLAKRGWTVVATARRDDELRSLAAEVSAGSIIPVVGDVADRQAIAALVSRVEGAHGPIARAMLNAGIYIGDKEASFSPDAIWRTFEVNVGGTVNCLAPIIDAMVARGQGQIAITSSVAGYGGLPRSLGYGPTKAALFNMAESLRLTYGARGLLIQVISPGFVKTPATAQNTFPMPFLVTADKAAETICEGLDKTAFEIAFPRRLAWALKALNHLPYGAYFSAVTRVTGR